MIIDRLQHVFNTQGEQKSLDSKFCGRCALIEFFFHFFFSVVFQFYRNQYSTNSIEFISIVYVFIFNRSISDGKKRILYVLHVNLSTNETKAYNEPYTPARNTFHIYYSILPIDNFSVALTVFKYINIIPMLCVHTTTNKMECVYTIISNTNNIDVLLFELYL